MLNKENCIFAIIDVQDKLVKAAKGGESLAENVSKVAKAAQILDIPVIITEQYPKGLGATVAQVKNALSNAKLIENTSFSAMNEPEFENELVNIGKTQILICGIETHICVLQTAADLLSKGYEVYVLKDGVSSRKEFENDTGIELLKQYGAKITCTEIVLFEWLKTSKNPNFKQIQALIK